MSNIICFIDDQLNLTVPLVKALGLYKKIRDEGRGENGEFKDIVFKVIYILEDKAKENSEDLEVFEKNAKEELKEIGEESGYYIIEMKDEFPYEDIINNENKAKEFVEKITKTAKIEPNDDVLYMIDLDLCAKDEEKLQSEDKTQTLSMAIYGALKSGDSKYKFYSSYSESAYMEIWLQKFQEYFGEKAPKIISRAFLQANCFNCKVGDEILNEFSL